VSGHSQDVVINLPASQSAQPGSSVVFGFFGVLIVIVVLIVAVIVYFKRVR
jgi:Mg2+ and Co2+ transporter CorA